MRNVPAQCLHKAHPWPQHLLNRLTAAVLIADPEFQIRQWNAAAEQILKKEAETLFGKNLPDLLTQYCRNDYDIAKGLHRVAEQGANDEVILLIRPDKKPLIASCYAIRCPGTGGIESIIVVMEEPVAELGNGSAIKEKPAESVFQSYLDNSLAPGWIVDEDGYAHFMNKRALETWRLTPSYQYKHCYELFPKQIADEFLASDQQVLETGKPISFVVPSLRIDGTPGFFMLQKYLLPLKTAKRFVVGQAIDISEEINTREALRKSNELFSYVAKAVSDCIWDWDMNTGKIFRTDALVALTGYTPQEINSCLDWWMGKVHPKDRKRIKNRLSQSISQGDLYCEDEYRFRCRDGRYRHFVDKGYIVYHDGKPIRAIGVVHDITEKKELVAKLLAHKEHQQKKISRAIIAAQDEVCNELGKELHDHVNQVLSSASILLEYARRNPGEDSADCLAKSQQYIDIAIEEIRKISKSLNTSLLGDVGLMKPIQEIVANMKLMRPVEVQLDYDASLEQHLSAELKLMVYRIIQEQANNILKYAEASEVVIAIKINKRSLHLVVRDNGKGFNLKKVKRGIGLANMRNRAEALNGVLNIITAPGKGCSVEVTVPYR